MNTAHFNAMRDLTARDPRQAYYRMVDCRCPTCASLAPLLGAMLAQGVPHLPATHHSYLGTVIVGALETEVYARDLFGLLRRVDRVRRLIAPAYARRVCTRHRGSMAHADMTGWHRALLFALFVRTDDSSGVWSANVTRVFTTVIPAFPDTGVDP